VQPYSIIIVANELMIGSLLKMMIQKHYPTANISIVVKAEDALRLYQQSGADLIITDKNIGTIDGLELTRTLRAWDAALPIIIMSGDPGVEAQAIAAGATLFLSKPEIIRELPLILPKLLGS
jgi:CheY-like chemotaxis protein